MNPFTRSISITASRNAANGVRYGRTLTQRSGVRTDMTPIVNVAQPGQDPVMLMTLAADVPKNYSRGAFDQHLLGDRRHLESVENSGWPDMLAAVSAHNAVMRRLALARRNVLFVDQDAILQQSGRNVDKACHHR